MKRFIINILKFALVLVIAYPLLTMIWRAVLPPYLINNIRYIAGVGQLSQRLSDADTTTKRDVLVIGSSHAYRGYDPRIFKEYGLTMFNLGSSAQTPVQTEILLNRYIDKIKPKYVMFDIAPLQMQDSGIESSTDLIANANWDAKTVEIFIAQKNIIIYNSLIIRLFNNITHRKVRIAKNSTDQYIAGGFTQSFKKRTGKESFHKPAAYTVLNEQREAVNRIIRMLNKRNIKLIFVRCPTTRESYSDVKNNGYMDSVFRSFGEYYDFNTAMNLPDTCFYDDVHLNQSGVKVFDKRLLDSLTKNGAIR